jgi:cytochrome c551/c552
MRRSRFAWLLIAFVAAGFVVAPFALRRLLWQWEQNPLLRGRELALEAGCVTCHFPYRGQEIPNPGSRWAVVPRFEAGNAMMYVDSKQEIEEFIRFGAPISWLDSEEASTRLATQRIRMPAYEERLSDDEIELLTTWASVVEAIDPAGDELAAQGRQLAREHGCISCHGLEGAGGRPNAGSLGGFVPGFLGANFTDLVESRAEFDEWVTTGTLERLVTNPLVRRAWRRQAIAMPAYDDVSDADLDALWAWVDAAREAYGR